MSDAKIPFLIREDQFLSEMKETVDPCLDACVRESFLYREEGRPIYCSCFAPKEPKAAVVLSHGFTETADKYREVIWYFLQAGYAVAAMEHSGHGRSYSLLDDKELKPSESQKNHGRKEQGQNGQREIKEDKEHQPSESQKNYSRKEQGQSGQREIKDNKDNRDYGQQVDQKRIEGSKERGQTGSQEGWDRVYIDTWMRYRDDLLFVAHTVQDGFRDLPLFLFGHSMGGGIAASAAAKEPALFAGAVLSSPMIRPVSGGIPWMLTKGICGLYCAAGKAADYAPGQGPCNLDETFEDSAGSSKPRFQYYQEIRRAKAYCQMGGATYGWMRAAAKLSDWLLSDGWKTLSCPLLLFQADKDTFVMNAQQNEFMQKVQSHNQAVRLIHVDGTKHEIFNSEDKILREYWTEIITFYNNCRK